MRLTNFLQRKHHIDHGMGLVSFEKRAHLLKSAALADQKGAVQGNVFLIQRR
jgi:hypothetical protein